jgi:hypothetical protein
MDSTTGALIKGMKFSTLMSARAIPNCFKDGNSKVAGMSAGLVWFPVYSIFQLKRVIPKQTASVLMVAVSRGVKRTRMFKERRESEVNWVNM